MANNLLFNEVLEKHFKTLKQYIPVVDKVHGKSHPKFHKIRALFEEMALKIQAAGKNRPELNEEFNKLEELTDNYTVPDDVCESYEAVYKMLFELDKAYRP